MRTVQWRRETAIDTKIVAKSRTASVVFSEALMCICACEVRRSNFETDASARRAVATHVHRIKAAVYKHYAHGHWSHPHTSFRMGYIRVC